MSAVLLNQAAAWLEDPGAWTQGARARLASGGPTWPLDELASSWSLGGLLERAAGDGIETEAGDQAEEDVRAMQRRVSEVLVEEGCLHLTPDDAGFLRSWNDEQGRRAEDVARVLRKAAARCP